MMLRAARLLLRACRFTRVDATRAAFLLDAAFSPMPLTLLIFLRH